MSAPHFVPDPKLQPSIDAQAAKAIDATMQRFSIMLDWSDEGIEHVEEVLQKLHLEIAKASLPPERILKVAMAFGCYVGETFRRNHGGTWGVASAGDRKSWAVMSADGKLLISAVDKVRSRLTAGAGENVWDYYRALLKQVAGPESDSAFTADANIQKVAEAYSLDAVDFAKASLRIKLDWTDQSVRQIEDILTRLQRDMAKAKPSDEQIFGMAKMFGSYIGEVFRRNHGGQWGIVAMDGQKFPGFQSKHAGHFWPWGKVSNRLVNGPEDNIWHYYQVLLEKAGGK